MRLQTIYGTFEVEPVIADILATKEMLRLGKINQYGAIYQLYHEFRTTRLEHSIGVFGLLRTLGASLEEQIAGLIHDVSHTAFSHVIDFILGDLQKDISYHEEIADKYLENSQIADCISKHGFDLQKILAFEKGPSLLELDYPDLCADRLDYILCDLHIFEIITKEEVENLLFTFVVFENKIVMNDLKSASFLANKVIEGNKKTWNSPYQIYLAKHLSDIVGLALKKKLILKEEIMGTDNRFFRTLHELQDEKIQSKFKNITKKVVVTNDSENYNFHIHTKARVIDPMVLIDGTCVRLSKLDKDFENNKKSFLDNHNKGYFISVREREEGEEIS